MVLVNRPPTEDERRTLFTIHRRGPQPKNTRIRFFTGTRADWSKLKPLADATVAAGYVVDYLVTGMHMEKEYGMTKFEVRKQLGKTIYEYSNHGQGPEPTLVQIETMKLVRKNLLEEKPDLFVVHGDRVEAIAACTVAAQLSIRCAHVEGGEVSGSIDEKYRHSCSELSDYHFVSSKDAERRVLRLGAHPNTIFTIGSPELDAHRSDSSITIEQVGKEYDILYDDYGIVTFHSVVSETDTMRNQAESLFDCLRKSGRRFVVIEPNNDPGNAQIRDVMASLDPCRFLTIPNMAFEPFSTLMKNSSAIIGNSSAGVREAPFLGVPSLNVGTRQNNRAKDAPSITHATAFEAEKNLKFLKDEWGKRYRSHDGFGRGTAAREFVEILGTKEFWGIPLQRSFHE